MPLGHSAVDPFLDRRFGEFQKTGNHGTAAIALLVGGGEVEEGLPTVLVAGAVSDQQQGKISHEFKSVLPRCNAEGLKGKNWENLPSCWCSDLRAGDRSR